MKKIILSIFALVMSAQLLWTNDVTSPDDIPAYYANLDDQSGKNLFDAVQVDLKKGNPSMSYDGLWTAYKTSDVYPAGHPMAGKIWDMYGGCSFTAGGSGKGGQCGTYSDECDCYNREHSIPKSWFGGAESKAGADLLHIVPTDGKVNGMRSNYAFGEVQSATYSYNGSKLGSSVSSISTDRQTIAAAAGTPVSISGTVFEPIDEYKGDFARGYMGTMVRWANGDYQTFTSGDGAKIFSSGYTAEKMHGLTAYGVTLLMKWHREDPVSQKEIDRNNGIQKTQGNRNPFIDYPYLAEYIWGEHAGEAVDMSKLMPSTDPDFIPGVSDGLRNTTDPAITSPKGTVDCGATDINEPTQKEVTLKGINLEAGNLSLAISGTNAAYFTINISSVSNTQAEAGQPVIITYTPAAEGDHSATLTISGCGVTSHTVTLTGKCTATHTINWIDANSSQTTKVATGDPLVLPDNTPANCSDDRVFMGWTAATSVTAEPSDLFTEASGNVTAPATYYAVYADKEVTGGGDPEANKATSISVGDKVVIVCEKVTKEMSEFSTTSTIYGIGASYTTKPAGTLSFDVVAGKSADTYAFLNGTNYLNWSSGNSLSTASSLSDNTSWTVTFDSNGNAAIKNAKDSSRRLLWNVGSPRFACYTQTPGSNYYNVQLYAITGGTTITYSNYSLSCGGATGIEHTKVEQVATKLLIDGQFYILRDGKLYTITGMQVR